MAYEKQTWATGDVITAEKLNHIEDGISNSTLIVNLDNDGVLDKTYGEIETAIKQGIVVAIVSDMGDYVYQMQIYRCNHVINQNYTINAFNFAESSTVNFKTNSESKDEYPVIEDD